MNEQVETMYKQMLGVTELPDNLRKTYSNILFMINRVDGSTKSNPQVLALVAAIAGCSPQKADTQVEQAASIPPPTQPPNPENKTQTPNEEFQAGTKVIVIYDGQPRHGTVFSPSDKPDMLRVSLVNDNAKYRDVHKKNVKLRE